MALPVSGILRIKGFVRRNCQIGGGKGEGESWAALQELDSEKSAYMNIMREVEGYRRPLCRKGEPQARLAGILWFVVRLKLVIPSAD